MSRGHKSPAEITAHPRINLSQVLAGHKAMRVRFYAVIINPENSSERLASIPLYETEPGEVVELVVEREKVFPTYDAP